MAVIDEITVNSFLTSEKLRISRKGNGKVKFKDLLYGTDVPYDADLDDLEVTGLAYNSNKVEKGYAFICIKGYHTDGHIYAMDAAFRGAAVIICEEDIDIKAVPVVRTDDSRKLLSRISANFYGAKDAVFHLYGITGTNGKTTISCMLKSIIEADARICGLLGTIGYYVGGKEYEAQNTTPESSDLQRMFAEMRDEGIENCVMEVSSHALALGKVDDIRYDASVFTNLTMDHMDFHKDIEDYYQTKKKLFYLTEGACIVNLDDDYGKRLYEELRQNGKKAVGYSLKDRKADYCGEILETTEKGSLVKVTESGLKTTLLRLNTPGIFTIYNGLAALACAREGGYSYDSIQRGLEKLKGVPGRFELVANSKEVIVIVDYAHTPDALEKVLKTANDFKKGRLICVFGCGGDRDQRKRSLMGAAAGRYSDYCIITSDNPRTERQESITADIEAGIYETGCNYEIIENRYDAIKKAVSIYKKGDIILIAGKGHETYQIIGTEKFHFDDRETVKTIIENGE
ncbi:UDP-N-acetylmuramoyl-L-alanyl-D-glutamate--2,6-diaminopimelate ligase [Anoxybacterium hadale]|uniref:UDP-N-acetylmuramoyl-L-alanyl-D-glutamate--2, 6-diaminopimelate ligase n=1 Tax=Anoxybacterium hadale TaxID=3408580 RepID=A0ACD1AB04_9FIRM|nr:UDP-N-acetylmuramoyl-L-alanyl-D-glutamate--2,6-diaminopimelate ligase [Clostridiales bacterium]